MAKAFLHKAAKKMKKFADRNRRPMEFRVGDQVLVKLYPDHMGIFRGRHRSLIRKYERPFTVLKRIGKLACKLGLPPDFKVHSMFHVCNLKPLYFDEEDPDRSVPERDPILQRAPSTKRAADRQMKEILWHKTNYLGEPKKYQVKWIGEQNPTSEYAFRMKQRYPLEVKAYHEAAGAEDGA
ncbi:uncharacterized protein LOC116256622 [Nymphaea colorata]|uniref:uncharacterized protein LOC116256622 n=1 Tax=Nymphaea colorata TaxID=210225 RepID=UPI00129DDC09|nr:uncharacterized protein LOC116256622 [Nymphaea colorata]